MKTRTIRIPEVIAAAVEVRAKSHFRTLTGEILDILAKEMSLQVTSNSPLTATPPPSAPPRVTSGAFDTAPPPDVPKPPRPKTKSELEAIAEMDPQERRWAEMTRAEFEDEISDMDDGVKRMKRVDRGRNRLLLDLPFKE